MHYFRLPSLLKHHMPSLPTKIPRATHSGSSLSKGIVLAFAVASLTVRPQIASARNFKMDPEAMNYLDSVRPGRR